MRTLKTILLNQYIGAIVVALLWAEAVIQAVNIVQFPINALLIDFFYQTNLKGSFKDWKMPPALPTLLPQALSLALLFAAGYILATWIYADVSPVDDELTEERDPGEEQ